MKKVIFMTVAAFMVAMSANAQKGDWVLSGRLSGLDLTHTFKDGASNTEFGLGANVGYFVSDKFMVDATLGTVLGDGFNSFDFGVGARYYFSGNFYGRVGYNGEKYEKIDLTSFAKVSVGYDWFVSDKVFFEPEVYYQKNLAKGGYNQIGLSLGVGVKF